MHTKTITIFHNPRCSTSRAALAMIRDAGHEPVIVDYLSTPPDRETLARLITDAGVSVVEAMRKKDPLFNELGLGDAAVTDARRIDAMLAHPILIERPFVVTSAGTRLCRPLERIGDILPGLPETR